MPEPAIPSRDYEVELSDGNAIRVYANGERKAAALAEHVSGERALKVRLGGKEWMVKGRCWMCKGVVLACEKYQIVEHLLRCEDHRDGRV